MKKSLAQRVQFLREAATVERCHQTPHFGSYSVGLHSYNAVNLLLLLHPDPSINLIKALLWHDAAERLVGDLPATALWASEELRTAAEILERRINHEWEIDVQLTDEEGLWLRAIDKLELLLWSREQIYLGHHRFGEFVTILEDWFRKTDLPYYVRAFYETGLTNPLTRISNVF